MRRLLPLACLICALAFAACGGDDSGSGDEGTGNEASDGTFERAIADAQKVSVADFPAPQGKTLEQLASTLPPLDVGLATQTYVPGTNRLAFGLLDDAKQFVYGKSAVYVARAPNQRALGPFPAPADPLVVEPAFRSRGAAEAGDEIAAIYGTELSLPKPGRWYVLAMTKNQGRLYGAATEIRVARSSPIPDVGERSPRITTETVASAAGDIESIDTRVPPDDMHEQNFADVIGKKPVVLLFATPALCQTRVCGPVTDIAAELQKEYGERATFIHQEVYEENVVEKGLRKPLRQFGLQTEPWLFTFDRRGRIAARVEGSFGSETFRKAVEAALD